MGFYLRKSINLGGGVRLNLSKSGLGISGGIKGFRVGMNGRGTYVHMGAGGLYYRQQFSYAGRKSQTRAGSAPPPSLQEVPQPIAGAIFTENLVEPLDIQSGTAENKDVLDHFKARTDTLLILGIVAGVAAVVMLGSPGWAAALALLSVGLFVWRGIRGGRAALVYDLEGPALARYQAFVDSFEVFFSADKAWRYETRTATNDWKRNAGASTLMDRKPAAALADGAGKALRSNISIPVIAAAQERIYFLPDMVVVAHGANVTGFSYRDLELICHETRFIESGPVPRDARVVDHTWTYVNKNGGPDRRFNNNRQIPVCLYQQIDLRLGRQFARTFAKSRVVSDRPLREALTSLDQLLLEGPPTALAIGPPAAEPRQEAASPFQPPPMPPPRISIDAEGVVAPPPPTPSERIAMADPTPPAASASTPFGITLGSPIAELVILEDLGEDKYLVTPPKAHPLFSQYIVRATPRLGVVWVKGVTEMIENDSHGVATRAMVDRIADQLSNRYGRGSREDFLLPGSIWSEPQYWLSALEARERSYNVIWERRKAPGLPADLDNIFLGAVAPEYGAANVHLEYASTAIQAANAEYEQSLSDIL